MEESLNPSHRHRERILKGLVDFKAIEYIDGVKLIYDIPAARIVGLRDKLVVKPDDVFVCAYPKCGTTWMQQIVKLIANNGVETGVDHDAFVPWIDHMSVEEVEAMSSPRHFKTHLPYQLMPGGGDPANATGKYIYVIRNPKDVIVSYYMFYKMAIPPDELESWKDVFDAFCKGDTYFGGIFKHFLSWWSHKEAKNIFIISYEEMKIDLKTVVSRLAAFLGYQLSADTVQSIAEQTVFDNMKNNPAANKKHINKTSFSTSGTHFLRKGIIGDWKNVLTAEESSRIDALVAEKFAGTNLNFQ